MSFKESFYVKKIIFIMLSILLVTLSGCGEIKEANDINKMFMSDVLNEELEKLPPPDLTDYSEEERREAMYNFGLKQKELETNLDANDVVIIVNDIPIDKKTIYLQEAMASLPNVNPLKVELIKLIRGKVALSEAVRLGLEASQEDQDMYMEGLEMLFEQDPERESYIFGMLEGRGISDEDFLKEQRDSYIKTLQINELKKSLPEGTDYDKYLDKLVAKADIEILDPEIYSVLEIEPDKTQVDGSVDTDENQ